MAEADDKAGSSVGPTPEARALARLAAEKRFYVHLATYAVVIAFLLVVDYVTGPGWWFFWPALGWGLAVVMHAVTTFGVGGFVGRDWEEQRLKELIDEERARR